MNSRNALKALVAGYKLHPANFEYLKLWSSALRAQNFSVVTLQDERSPQLPSIQTFRVDSSYSIKRLISKVLWKNLKSTIASLRCIKPDILIMVSSSPFNFLLGVLGKCFGSIVVSHIHDPQPHSSDDKKYFIQASQYLQLLVSDYALCFGENLKKDISKIYRFRDDKIFTLSHPVYGFDSPFDRASVSPDILSFFSDCNNSLVFSNVGRLEGYKGLQRMIDVFNSLPRELTNTYNIALLIAGKSSGSISLDCTQRDPHVRINLIERFLSNSEINFIINNSTCLVLPYKDGTQSGLVPTAARFQTPVICTQVGSIHELIDKYKFGITIPHSADSFDQFKVDLTKAVSDLVCNRNHRALLKNNANLAFLNEFSIDSFGAKCAKITQLLLKNRN